MDTSNGLVHHEVLETDKNGYTPDQFGIHPSGRFTGYNPTTPTCIEIVAKRDLEVRSNEHVYNIYHFIIIWNMLF